MRDPMTCPEFDPLRFNNDLDVTWIRNYDDFVDHIQINGMPDMISFDHDLGDDVARAKVANGMSKRRARREKRLTKSGHECLKYVLSLKTDQKLPTIFIHSSNPEGVKDMEDTLDYYGLGKSY